jgi:hypothetical protein
MIHRSTLAEPGGRPFYLKATITDKDDPKSEFNGTVEEYWLSPTKWRRVVKLRHFSQTRIGNGDKVSADSVPRRQLYFNPAVNRLLSTFGIPLVISLWKSC